MTASKVASGPMICFRRTIFYLFFCVYFPSNAFGLLDSIAVSGNPSPMTISTAIAGSDPDSVTDTSTTYSVSTLLTPRSITGQLNTSMPSGLTLNLALQAPLGATSQGSITLTTTAQNLVTNIIVASLQSGLTCTYTLSATAAVTPRTNQTVIVTLTLL